MRRTHSSLLSALSCAAVWTVGCSEEPPESRFVDAGHESASTAPPVEPVPPHPLIAASVELRPPSTWTPEDPSSSMRLAQFQALSMSDLPPAKVVITHFGPNGAGTVEANLERWAREVRTGSGDTAIPHIEEISADGLTITTFESEGSFTPAMGPRPDVSAAALWTSLAAIIEGGPEGPIYVKFTGPSDVVRAHRDGFFSLLRGARVQGMPSP